MNRQKGFEWWGIVGALLMMQGLSVWAGPIIAISNPSKNDQILSDLTVYGEESWREKSN